MKINFDGLERCRNGHQMREGSYRVYRVFKYGRWQLIRQCLLCKRDRDQRRRKAARSKGLCTDCKKHQAVSKSFCQSCLDNHKRYYVYGTMKSKPCSV